MTMNCQNTSEGEFYTLLFSKTTSHKQQNSACYLCMCLGVTMQKQSAIRYPKIKGKPIVYIKLFFYYYIIQLVHSFEVNIRICFASVNITFEG